MSRRTRRVFRFTLASLALAVLAWLALPKPSLYGETAFSTEVRASDGSLLRLTLAADDRYRLYTPLAAVAPAAVEATLLYEDRHYYRHPGVNPAALVRAAYTTYLVRDRAVGGSTITMQLARLRFGLETTSIGGKLWQIGRALQLERHYSKTDLLEAYLNLAPYGGNIEGIAAAARIYFGKSASALSTAEALALTVIPQNPVARHPITGTPGALQRARERLAARWHDEDRSQHELERLILALNFRPASDLPFAAPHAVADAIARQPAQSALQLTIRPDVQRFAENAVALHLDEFKNVGINNAAVLVVDHRSMRTVAAVGAAHYGAADIQGYINGTRAHRSPGSTLKPMLYGLAIDRGIIHPASLLTDAPKRFGAHAPENFDRGFVGPISATQALVTSRNLPAANLLAELGATEFHHFLQAGGIELPYGAEHYGLSMVLGGLDATLEEIVALYAMLANDGVWQPVRDAANGPAYARRRLLSPEAAFLIRDMLRQHGGSHIAGSGAPAPIAYKTGTSYGYRDAWTVGIAGPYVVGVWVGNFDGAPNPALTGRRAGVPLFLRLANAYADSTSAWLRPDASANVRQIPVCAGTGDLPGAHCPATAMSWFIPGRSPIKVSTVHRSIPINTATGRRSCRRTDVMQNQVFEFWPTDLAAARRRAGIVTASPPPWDEHCTINTQRNRGVAPSIQSPSPAIHYVRDVGAETATVTFAANSDADAKQLYWFVDHHYAGSAPAGEPLLWEAHPGNYQVRVVDDLGRAARVRMQVTGGTALSVAAVTP